MIRLKNKNNQRILEVFFVAILMSLWLLLLQGLNPKEAFALSVEEYCLVAEKLLEISIQELEERGSTALSSGQDQNLYSKTSEGIFKKYRRKREILFADYGTTMGDYLRYGAEQNRKVNAFLENNPDKKNTIDSLSSQLKGLRMQYESQ